MTEHAKDCFDNGNVLMRKDGKTMRNIPSATKTDDDFMRKKAAQSTDEYDGFSTHVKCRWCGGEIGETYIPKLKDGRNGKPYEIIINYEPCEACRKKWNTMVVCIEITDEEPYPDCLPIMTEEREIMDGYIDSWEDREEFERRVTRQIPSDDPDCFPTQFENVALYPTGRYTGVTLEAIKKYFTGDTSSIKNGSVLYLDQEMFDEAFGDYFTD